MTKHLIVSILSFRSSFETMSICEHCLVNYTKRSDKIMYVELETNVHPSFKKVTNKPINFAV